MISQANQKFDEVVDLMYAQIVLKTTPSVSKPDFYRMLRQIAESNINMRYVLALLILFLKLIFRMANILVFVFFL